MKGAAFRACGPQPTGPGKGEQRLRQQLQEQLRRLSFHDFARCLCHLLQETGYRNVRLAGRTGWKGRNSEGGWDIEAWPAAGLTHTRLLVQIKPASRPVQGRCVDELRGALLRAGAGQGLIITLGTFSSVAKAAAAKSPLAPVRLVAGEELLDLLIRHGIGLRQGTGGRWEADEGFFAALRPHDANTRPRSAGANPHAPGEEEPPLTVTITLWRKRSVRPRRKEER